VHPPRRGRSGASYTTLATGAHPLSSARSSSAARTSPPRPADDVDSHVAGARPPQLGVWSSAGSGVDCRQRRGGKGASRETPASGLGRRFTVHPGARLVQLGWAAPSADTVRAKCCPALRLVLRPRAVAEMAPRSACVGVWWAVTLLALSACHGARSRSAVLAGSSQAPRSQQSQQQQRTVRQYGQLVPEEQLTGAASQWVNDGYAWKPVGHAWPEAGRLTRADVRARLIEALDRWRSEATPTRATCDRKNGMCAQCQYAVHRGENWGMWERLYGP